MGLTACTGLCRSKMSGQQGTKDHNLKISSDDSHQTENAEGNPVLWDHVLVGHMREANPYHDFLTKSALKAFHLWYIIASTWKLGPDCSKDFDFVLIGRLVAWTEATEWMGDQGDNDIQIQINIVHRQQHLTVCTDKLATLRKPMESMRTTV